MAGTRRPRGLFLLLLLVLLGVTFITLSGRAKTDRYFQKARTAAREVADPVQSTVHRALQPVGDFIYGALQYRSLETENRRLRGELAKYQTAPVQAAAEQARADQVLAQDHLPFLSGIPSIAAQVVQAGSSNFEQTIEIDRGSSDGVVVGQPVVSADGLTGSVSAVSSHLATVTLVDDPTTYVGVRDIRSGVVGLGVGEGQGLSLQVEDINVNQSVKRGDRLVTSGLSLEPYPAGIPVGTVTHAASLAGALQLQVSMKLFVDLSNLEFVRVLLWSPGGG